MQFLSNAVQTIRAVTIVLIRSERRCYARETVKKRRRARAALVDGAARTQTCRFKLVACSHLTQVRIYGFESVSVGREPPGEHGSASSGQSCLCQILASSTDPMMHCSARNGAAGGYERDLSGTQRRSWV